MFTSRCRYRRLIASGCLALSLGLASSAAIGTPYTGYFSGTIASYYFTTPDVEPYVGSTVTGWYTFDVENAADPKVGVVTPYGIESYAGRETGCSLHVDGSCTWSQGTGPRVLTYGIYTRFGDFAPLPESLELYEASGIRVGQIAPDASYENARQYYFAGFDQGGSFRVTTPDAESDYLLVALNRYFGIELYTVNDRLLPGGPLDLFQTPDLGAASPGLTDRPGLSFFDNSFSGSCVRGQETPATPSCSGASRETRFFVDLATLQVVAGERSVAEPTTLDLLFLGLAGVLATRRVKRCANVLRRRHPRWFPGV